MSAGAHLPPPPRVDEAAGEAVEAALAALHATCLRRALVRQRWDEVHGRPRDVVIGVVAPGRGFRAHAWLEGDAPCHGEGFQELLRVTPRG